jgi:tetratricopeptide (TPR) repeat protein
LEVVGHRESARMHLRRVLELDPEHADALNYLGYLDVEQGINLDEAKLLIERALVIEPNNGAYLDSLGWLYYQLGHYEQALTYLQQAADLIEGDPTIYEHMGDTYFKLQDVQQAEYYWKQALRAGADPSTIEEKLQHLELLQMEKVTNP